MSNTSNADTKSEALVTAEKELESLTDVENRKRVLAALADADNPPHLENVIEGLNEGWLTPQKASSQLSVGLRLDADVLAYFLKKKPDGWQNDINRTLRKAVGL